MTPAGRAAAEPEDWGDAEPPTRVVMIAELQRIKRRARNRPWPILAVAAALAALLAVRVARKQPLVEASVYLTITEGSLSGGRMTVPLRELRAYVESVLLSDAKLAEVIERLDLYPRRAKLGMEFAIGELRDQLDIFAAQDDEDEDGTPPRSARIALTVSDTQATRAIALVHALAELLVTGGAEHRRRLADQLAAEIARAREGLDAELARNAVDRATRERELAQARADRAPARIGILALDLAALDGEHRRLEEQLARFAASRDVLSGEIAAAGLDTTIQAVAEDLPEPPGPRGALTAVVAFIVFVSGALAAAVFFGAFDRRLHDGEDVTRLGLPLLGTMPGFRGDDLGALRSRGALGRAGGRRAWHAAWRRVARR